MAGWQDDTAYACMRSLSGPEWAWEFLRRNPEYRSDYRRFISTWRALEADYGVPPERDFQRWKADPRAYLMAGDDAGGDGCRVDQDKVLIECALGDKWGFYQFPRDPALPATAFDTPPVWRELVPRVAALSAADAAYLGSDPARVALGFELDLPLGAQLERARLYLGSLAARRRREGRVSLRTVRSACDRWRGCLRLLDAEAAGVAEAESVDRLAAAGEPVAIGMLAEARHLRDGGYREILLLPEGH